MAQCYFCDWNPYIYYNSDYTNNFHYNNLGGIKANDGSWAYFSDWFECISYKTDLLYNQYLIPTGAYYNGTSTWNINVRYCEEGYWADNINAIAYELLNKIGG